MADDPWADDPHDPNARGGDAPRFEDDRAADGPNADLGTYASDREVEAPNPKKGMGTGVKVLVALLIGGVLLALLCCGGVFWEISASGLTPNDTPAGVRAQTDEMLTIDVPDDFTPQVSMGGEFPFMRWFADFRMEMAVYGAPGGGQLMLMKLRLPQGGGDQAQMEAQLKQGMNQNGNNNGGVRVDATESEERTLVTADGRSVDWTFSEGTGRDQQGTDLGAFREVKGTFADGSDVYILNLVIPEDEYDEAEIVAMLESIELVDPQTEPVPPGNEDVMEEAEVDAADIESDADAAADATDAEADAAADAEPAE